ncbi:glycosyltransferase family 2 protein [Nordella sp. HKS 07]|uniref:glycosyltransferase family 2 protein n=1 Tax=Nordella sp. HKS 07 TaxID=2712222 RepID=UPI0013E1EAD3|nr:glycosyltransferase family A protein [Nordella sp. HKS 07]QIG51833.1 glycosyltransferase family 2 protein [Nordella sp. HKS 07]
MMPAFGNCIQCDDPSERKDAPVLSIGLPVRNGQDSIERCIHSILSQDFADYEIIVSDNASSDATRDILKRLAQDDSRLKLHFNDADIGILENMNRVLLLARGQFFRWISHDDWMEPGCITACIGALRARSDAVGVTTGFTIHTSEGSKRRENYQGEFPTSRDAACRFERMLWFFHAGDGKYDPVYGTYRRDILLHTRRHGPCERSDWLLCAELALLAPIIHLAAPLANRTRSYKPILDPKAIRRRLNPIHGERLRSTPLGLYRDLSSLVAETDPPAPQLRRFRSALRRFLIKEVIRTGRSSLSTAKHQIVHKAQSAFSAF